MRLEPETSPVSFEVDVRRLPGAGLGVRFRAEAEQLKALAAAHDLVSVERFDVDLVVRNWRRDGVKVSGRVAADIVQSCIVSLEPVAQAIDETVEALFLPAGSKLAKPRIDAGGEMLLSADGPDAPELFEGDAVDVGALAEEFFALAVDPYPRAAGKAGQAPVAVATGEIEASSPFAKLKSLSGKS